MWKDCKVVMLPTNEKATNVLYIRNERLNFHNGLVTSGGSIQAQQLYIVSDDEIEADDWCMIIDKDSKLFGQFERSKNSLKNDQWGKIIATTDSSLTIIILMSSIIELKGHFLLPQPSQSFIKVFVEEYNKGNVITDVLVEYEEIPSTIEDLDYSDLDGEYRHETKIKINLKNNSIKLINIL